MGAFMDIPAEPLTRLTKYQFVGLDFAWSDPRSVSACLRGYGNGLAENYNRYYERMHHRYPAMPLETINCQYHLKRQRIGHIQQRIQYAVWQILVPCAKNTPVLLLGIVIGILLATY
jgi:hypothetical protein